MTGPHTTSAPRYTLTASQGDHRAIFSPGMGATQAQVRYLLRRTICCDGLGWFAGGLIMHRAQLAPVVRIIFTLLFMALRMRCRYSHALLPRAFTPRAR